MKRFSRIGVVVVMDGLITFFLVIVVLAIIGVIIYMGYDYLEYKKQTDSSFAKTSEDIQKEGSARVSNIRYVVDQVNSVNSDIYKTMTSNVTSLDGRIVSLKEVQAAQNTRLTTQEAALGNLSATSGKVVGGLNSLISINSNVAISGTARNGISLLNLPGMVNPDVQLMHHVSAVSGLTVQNIDASGSTMNSFQVCSRPDPSNNIRCLRFPNSTGDTYLTGLSPTSSVVVDSASTFAGPMTFGTADKRTTYGQITGKPDNAGTLSVDANSVAISSTGAAGSTPFRVSVAGADKIALAQDGTMSFSTPKLSIKNNSQTADIMFDSTNGKMVVAPASGSTSGTLRILGNVEATGTITPSAQ